MITFAHPRRGTELDWLAIDVNQHVALFSTGGFGPVPRIVVDQLPDVEEALERLGLLKVVGPCEDWPVDGADYSSWKEPCRRGLFGFDWGPLEGPPYVRITVPSTPRIVDELDDELVQRAAALVRLGVNFQLITAVQVGDFDVELWQG